MTITENYQTAQLIEIPVAKKHNYPKNRKVSQAVIEVCKKMTAVSAANRRVKCGKFREKKKDEFLENYFECNGAVGAANKIGVSPRAIMQWLVDDEEFKAAYERLRPGLDAWRREKNEQFINSVGCGDIDAGKGSTIAMPNVTAGIFALKAQDRKKYGDREMKESRTKTKVRRVNITSTNDDGTQKTEILELTEENNKVQDSDTE